MNHKCCAIKVIVLLALIAFNHTVFSQKNNWTQNPFEHKVFVENKGQFDKSFSELFVNKQNKISKIAYAAKVDGVDMYFHASGLVYKRDKAVLMSEKEKEAYLDKNSENEFEAENENKYKLVSNILQVEWLNANPNAEIISELAEPFYFTYGSTNENNHTTKVNVYKKIIYKNIYPHIDLEYVFPENKKGIKYSFILHSGSNVED